MKFNNYFVIFFIILIVFIYNSDFYMFIYDNNISFSMFRNVYNRYLGGINPIKEIGAIDVFGEKIEYSNISLYNDGIRLEVSNNYLVPINYRGIVVFVGYKDNYGNTIIIENDDGVWVWYGNICNSEFNLFDSVYEGDYVGEVCGDYLYLVYSKNNEFLDYKYYLK